MREYCEIKLVSFPTELGWMGLALNGSVVQQLKFGYQSEPQLLLAFNCHFNLGKFDRQLKKWRSSLQRYAEGQKQDLSDIAVDLGSYPKFQSTVLSTCRKIGYGMTMTYGQLAEKSGSPNAARAVGTAMKNNRYPLIVPCHRVVASNGIGGYSAGEGIRIKTMLLELEGVSYSN